MALTLSVLDQCPVGEGFPPGQALHNSVDLAGLADTLGYNRYWVAEHHGMPSVASPAPEILLARITGNTKHIRIGSGGIMLPHYAPLKVVEQFAMLEALAPGRIDLGLGRAPGSSQIEAMALVRNRETSAYQSDDFGQQLMELRAFLDQSFPRDHLFSRINISPAMAHKPDVWLLGSSLWSASAAAQLALPFAFAHFFSGPNTRAAFEHYFEAFRPTEESPKPRAIMAIGGLCAPTQEEADYLGSSAAAMWRRIRKGIFSPIPTPENALPELADGDYGDYEPGAEFPRFIRGTPDSVHARLQEIAEKLHIEEMMVITMVHDHQMRRRSYELLAKAAGLHPRD